MFHIGGKFFVFDILGNFPVFSLSGKMNIPIPCLPSALATLDKRVIATIGTIVDVSISLHVLKKEEMQRNKFFELSGSTLNFDISSIRIFHGLPRKIKSFLWVPYLHAQ